MDDAFRADLRERQLKTCNDSWYSAAKRALQGDNRALIAKVLMYEAPPVALVASDDNNHD